VRLPIPKGYTFLHYVNDFHQKIKKENRTWSESEGYAIIYGPNNIGSKRINLDDKIIKGRYFLLGCFNDKGYLGYNQKIAKVVDVEEKPEKLPDECKW
jgi:hypothetical protein